jgi:hypothetical protein
MLLRGVTWSAHGRGGARLRLREKGLELVFFRRINVGRGGRGGQRAVGRGRTCDRNWVRGARRAKGGLSQQQAQDLAVRGMHHAGASVASERVKHGPLLLAPASVEQRVQFRVMLQKEPLERDHRVLQLSAALRLAAVLRLKLRQLLAQRDVLRLKRVNDNVFVLESSLELAVYELRASSGGNRKVVDEALAAQANGSFGGGTEAKVLGHEKGKEHEPRSE